LNKERFDKVIAKKLNGAVFGLTVYIYYCMYTSMYEHFVD